MEQEKEQSCGQLALRNIRSHGTYPCKYFLSPLSRSFYENRTIGFIKVYTTVASGPYVLHAGDTATSITSVTLPWYYVA